MGPRCLIDDTICNHNKTVTCFNKDELVYFCDQCEIVGTKLIISFDKNLILSLSIFIHFIDVKVNSQPIRTTTVKRNHIRQDSITIYWSLPFHIVFIELINKTYYLIFMQQICNQSTIIETTTINSSHQCLHINELFNKTIVNIKIKLYMNMVVEFIYYVYQ